MKFFWILFVALLGTSLTAAQDTQGSNVANDTSTSQGVPRVIRFSGRQIQAVAEARTVQLTFSIYEERMGGEPIWMETQLVNVDEQGRYSVLLGASANDGLPADLFATGNARWIGIRPVEGGAAEEPRIQIVSVPYALQAGDAQSLGGRSVTDFVLTRQAQQASGSSAATAPETGATINDGSSAGTPNFLAKFETPTSIVNSSVFETSGNVGIGTTNPLAKLDVAGSIQVSTGINVTSGDIALGVNQSGLSQFFKLFTTPHAVANTPSQLNMGLFDGSFTGFNVKNVRDGSFSSASIEFSTHHGGVSAGTRMTIDKDGRVGIGTTTPTQALEVVGTAKVGTLTDGFITMGLAQINRSGGAVEMQFPGGSGNDVRMFSGTASPVSFIASSGNVGIGTASPTSKLHVQGAARASSFTDGFINFGLAQINRTGGAVEVQFPGGAGNDVRFFSSTPQVVSFSGASGNLGLGTASPSSKVDAVDSTATQVIKATQNAAGAGSFSVGTPPPVAVRGDASSNSGVTGGVLGIASSPGGFGVLGESLSTTGNAVGVYGFSLSSSIGIGVWGESRSLSGDTAGVFGKTFSSTGQGVQGHAAIDTSQGQSSTGDGVGVWGQSDRVSGTGVFGIATDTGGDTVGVYGRVVSSNAAASAAIFDTSSTSANVLIGRSGAGLTRVVRIDATGKGFFNGGTQTGGADFAESVTVREEKSQYEPGDVLAIDATGVRRFTKVATPYSTLVAGIYSTKPGVLATPHGMDDPRINTEEVPLAVVGIVPCKVTNENGEIVAGDLLVASSRAGYAMKGTDRARMNAAVIGKALQGMRSSSGVIEVLVSLQ
jgi:hypothetical protein